MICPGCGSEMIPSDDAYHCEGCGHAVFFGKTVDWDDPGEWEPVEDGG